LRTERDNIFAIALLSFDNANATHIKALQTNYIVLTGVDLCPRFGPHWETIGFQGEDPSTDLRGVGMLGLLQLLHFVRKHQELARQIHKLSRDETKNFPFSVVSINLSRVVLQTLRGGTLNGYCNQCKSTIKAANELHTALYYNLYTEWKKGNKTIVDFPPLLKTLTETSIKHPTKIISLYKKSLNPEKGKAGAGEDFVEI